MKNRGNHVFLDFVGFIDENLEECCANIFDIMKDGIKQTTMKCMFEKMVVLKEDTEEGFTSVILLDESHITCHAYTKKGLLALDVFTCGSTDPQHVAEHVKSKLESRYPNIECVSYVKHKRFLYY
jgi:S-adenosylmethionine/arginine decarboxylase-like enzyme